MNKPRTVMFYPDTVKSFNVLGEEIRSLSGPYTPELKAAIAAAGDEHTIYQDASSDWLNSRAREIFMTATERKWVAQEDNTMGGWCITVADIPGTPADGNPVVGNFVTEEMARHVVAVHNDSLEVAHDVAVPVDNPSETGEPEG